jgi:hypothetical protein
MLPRDTGVVDPDMGFRPATNNRSLAAQLHLFRSAVRVFNLYFRAHGYSYLSMSLDLTGFLQTRLQTCQVFFTQS